LSTDLNTDNFHIGESQEGDSRNYNEAQVSSRYFVKEGFYICGKKSEVFVFAFTWSFITA